jgi:hypothetical protein
MKSQRKSWADPIIALMIMMNSLLLFHFLQYGSMAEQTAQFLAVLLYYLWLSKWVKKL